MKAHRLQDRFRKAFCKKASGKIKEAYYILVHHTSGKYENAANEMDSLLGIHRTNVRELRCRCGKYKELN